LSHIIQSSGRILKPCDHYIIPAPLTRVFFGIRRKNYRFVRSESVWLNDVNAHLINFYRVLVSQTDLLVMSLLRVHAQHGSGSRELFERAGATLSDPDAEPLPKAIAYFVDNCMRYGAKQNFVRSTFSEGLVADGKGLKKSRILRLLKAAKLLKDARLTETDYRHVFAMAKPTSLMFLDPPYPEVSNDLYGPHKFDDDAFVEAVQANKERFLFLLTLNDTERNRAASIEPQ
jgi:site-specific DNA-adenine methylase